MMEDDKFKLPPLDEAPWLILNHTNTKLVPRHQTFRLMNNKSYTNKTIVELVGKSILASNQGWLILGERLLINRSRYSLWNPVTQQYLSLPELPDPSENEVWPKTCLFTSPPDGDRPSVVVLFFENQLLLCKLTMKDGFRWVKQILERDGKTLQISLPTALDGYIYANINIVTNNSDESDDDDENDYTIFTRITVCDNDCDSNIVLFQPLEIEAPCENILFPEYTCRTDFLLEVCGVLYAIHIMKRGKMADYEIVKACVWRLDLSQMRWIQVESLGGRAFLLGDNCCSWCWADASQSCSGIEGDSIYIIINSFLIRTIHQYRLRDDSYIVLNAYHNIWLNNPIWFMPRNPTRSSPGRVIAGKSEDAENTKHVEEIDEMKMDRPALSLFCELPSDILISVAKCLHLFDYMNLRTTCKILRSIVPRPEWRSNCSYPLFMSLKNKKGGICELWDPFQNICHTIVPHHSPYLVSTIECFKDGWFLLRIEGHSLQCFNPFIGKSYKYPSLGMSDMTDLLSLAFSTCPTSPNCMTVGIMWEEIAYFRAGNDDWEYADIEFDSETGIKFEINDDSSLKYHDGAFYILGKNGNLGVLKMVDGEWIWRVHKGPTPEQCMFLKYGSHSGHLAEIDGQLISVFIKGVGERVQVFKFDTLCNNWVVLDDLGDYMLFISPASSFSISTKDNNMRNKIYLPKRISNEMVFYSLNTRMYHTSSSQHPSKNFYGMRSQSFCCWI